VSAKIWRYLVELEVSGREPRRVWQQLPVDRGLSDTDGDGLPDLEEFAAAADRRRVEVYVVTVGGSYIYETSVDNGDREAHADTRFSMTDLLKDGWNEQLYTARRQTLADVILARQGSEGASAWVQITPMRSVLDGSADFAPWGALFLALDAISFANDMPGRGQRPRLFSSLRFTDALSKYK
jgi:hypothetical protein